MKLTELATTFKIEEKKIVHYLLDLEHIEGKSKAKFFMRFGFTPENWGILQKALISHGKEHEIITVTENPFGHKYQVNGAITTPDDRNPDIKAIWFIATGTKTAKIVTAYKLGD